MFVIILTLSADFLATTLALAAELPEIGIDTSRVQEVALNPNTTLEEAFKLIRDYASTDWYDKIELIYR